MCIRRLLCSVLLLFASSCLSAQSTTLPLHEGWKVQSGCKVQANGDVISTAAYLPAGWYSAVVPSTVLAVLVDNNVYPDPYYGMNLRSLPGMTYPVGAIFTNLPMAADSPFACPWWYRTEFRTPASYRGQNVFLHFDGINYRATIWLNGHRVAGPDRVVGAYRQYEFEVSEFLSHDQPNVLAVSTAAQTENDLGLNWVDWNPSPPDKNLGLYRDVYLTSSGPVAIRAVQVLSDLDAASLASADLTIHAELTNLSGKPVSGSLNGSIDAVRFGKVIELAAGEIKEVTLSPADFRQLHIEKPRVWWPARIGKQEMYRLDLSFKIGRTLSDSATVNFGIRRVTSELTPEGYRLFSINGRKILIRGAGWAGDMLQRHPPNRLEEELRYVSDIGLNTVRLEGQLEPDRFFDLADRMGILVMPGWCCCSLWEQWDKWTPETKTVALESLRSQIGRLRNHPSVFVWLNGSDTPPTPEIEQAYLEVEKELNWPNPTISSAAAKSTTVSGPPGVKMSGPYEYVPPMYWYSDAEKKFGGGYGFNTETSPGPAPPLAESIQRMMPKEHWWPIDEVWGYHAGSGSFKTIELFKTAMDERYGAPQNLADFSLRSQVMTYDNERAMFEAYSRNKYNSTGVIQWMLNNAWPGLIWHLYDYYLVPGGGYFGAKKANEPVHALYGYDDNAVWLVNNLYNAVPQAKLTVSVLNLDLSEKFSQEATLDIAPDSSTQAISIPKLDGLSSTYFVRMELRDRSNKLLSSNFYWLSTKPETLDWTKTNYFVTPVVQHADLRALNSLEKVQLRSALQKRGPDDLTVTVTNPTRTIAFAVELKVENEKGELLAPVLIEDNYFPLLPAESRTVRIQLPTLTAAESPVVHIGGWNVVPSAARRIPAKAAAP